MLYNLFVHVFLKLYHNLKQPLYLDLLGLFCPTHITRDALNYNNLVFYVVRSNTTQFFVTFILPVTRLWFDLPNHVESIQLQKFKCNANAILLARLFFSVILVFIHFNLYSFPSVI